MAYVADGYVCEGRCPGCGARVRLTWQRTGEVDCCECGMEAVLVVETRNVLQWYWRDPADLPAREVGEAGPAGQAGPGSPAVQLHLV